MNLYVAFRYVAGKTAQPELYLVGVAFDLEEAKSLVEGKSKGYHLTWYEESGSRRRWAADTPGRARCVIVELRQNTAADLAVEGRCPHPSFNSMNGLCDVCQQRIPAHHHLFNEAARAFRAHEIAASENRSLRE